jgi:gliding motility-associated-like protein
LCSEPLHLQTAEIFLNKKLVVMVHLVQKRSAFYTYVVATGICFLFCIEKYRAQVTLAFQGGEVGNTWTYTSSGANAEAITESTSPSNIVSGAASLVAGGNAGGGSCFAGGSGNGSATAKSFTFSAVNISTSNSSVRTLKFNWGNRLPACNGTGWDSGENLSFTAYHDGVSQGAVSLATGSNNAVFAIQGNQYTWSIPACVNSFYFMVSVTTNRRDEFLFLDNVQLTAPALNPALLQPSAINGNTAPCPGTSGTYSVTQVTSVKYTWSGLPAGASFTGTNGTINSWSMGINWGSAAPGTYTLSVTPSDFCNTTSGPAQTLVVTIPNIAPLVLTGNLSFCAGDSLLLSSSYVSGNTWSTGESNDTIYVHAAGTYSVSVTTVCGTQNASQTITINPDPVAGITADGPLIFCERDSVVLSSSAGTGNVWSTGEAGSSITADTSGIYSLVVSNSCGSDSTSVTVQVIPGNITALISTGGPLNLCPGDSVTLSSNIATGNSWSTGDTTQSITVHTAGTYTLTVSNGCTSDATTQTILSTPAPASIISASGPTTFCDGNTITLSSASATGNLWSTGDTNASIQVDSSGIYSLIVSNICGSDSSAISITVITSSIQALISTSGSLNLCPGDSVTLSSNFPTGNTWSNGDTTQSIVVHSAGTYTLSVNTSCASDTETQLVTSTPLPISVITPGGPTTFCDGNTLTLSSAAAIGNLWSTGDTNTSIQVDTSGTYSLIVSNACGSDSSAISVTVIPSVIQASISTNGPLDLCPGDSVTLSSNLLTGNSWSTGDTTQSITVHNAGSYVLAVSNTCATDTETQLVTSTPLPSSVISAGGPLTFCQGNSVTLSSAASSGNLWSTGASGNSIVADSSGIYSLSVSNACGSDSSAVTVTVIPDTITATISASGPLSLCPGNSVILTSSYTTGNLWSTGASTQSISVNSPGTYTLTVSTSCAADSTTQIVTSNPATSAVISANGPTTFCQGNSVTLSSASTSGNVWSTGETTSSITVNTAGTYTLTVNGICGSATDTEVITVNPLPTVNLTPSGNVTICAGTSVSLTASGGSNYLWSNGATGNAVSINTAGTYNVVSTNSCGSITSASVVVSLINLPSIAVSAGGTICQGDSLLLTASGGGPYHWNTGSTSASVYATHAGNYTVSSTNSCGTVSATANMTVSNVDAHFIADTLSGVYPLEVHFTNTSSTGAPYTWTFGDGSSSTSTSPTHTFGSSGTYTVTLGVSNSNGCTDSYTITIVVSEPPSLLEIPNIFTPNGDDVNDLFIVRYENLNDFHMDIFDRWGLKTASINNAAKGWDGKTQGGNDAPDGVYFYIITATGNDQKAYEQSGYVRLNR